MADSGINDQLIKMQSTVYAFMDKMCFKLINQLFCCLLFLA